MGTEIFGIAIWQRTVPIGKHYKEILLLINCSFKIKSNAMLYAGKLDNCC